MNAIADDAAFAAATGAFRRELHVHSYRMLGNFDEAEDAVQETFLRAWRSRDSFDGSAALRAWLYKIATNVCLDAIRRANRRPIGRSLESIGEVDVVGVVVDASESTGAGTRYLLELLKHTKTATVLMAPLLLTRSRSLPPASATRIEPLCVRAVA